MVRKKEGQSMARQVTPAEEAQIIELYNKGVCMTTIAKLLGRSGCTVSRRIAEAREQGLLIERPKVENPLKRDRYNTPACCKGCIHRRLIQGTGHPTTFCSYANDMEDIGILTVRGCPVEECTNYKKGKPSRRYPVEIERGVKI